MAVYSKIQVMALQITMKALLNTTCDRHYYLNGNIQLRTVKRTCQSDGKWSGKDPICEEPKCNLIEDFYGGNVKYFWGRNLYSKAFYSCDENYSMIPINVGHSTCENNLRWEPPPPKCYKQAYIYVPNDGFLRGKKRGKVWHDESYKICCHRGFEVKIDGIVPVNKELCTNIRNNNGTLEPNAECVEEWCEPDMRHTKYKHEDGFQFTSRIPSNEDVWISCEKGYAFYNSRNQLLLSPQKRRCVQGQIKGAPTCIEAKSSLAGYPYNQFTLFRDSKRNRLDRETFIEPNERIEIYCRDGYELYVESNREYLFEFITTSRYGVFDKEKNKFPVCLESKFKCFGFVLILIRK
ncbi:sushi, von Willebrand factor type A, EGF and pentraxin domain-containing protein 1-like [Ruditapes philippinarum]|uniref:sushi, von Willebrand factor type A, EGF and pentraxin domain-containing protein 1-like n=1 Tax=Ruditapes philippinarum TaxID=129788 RepID=UPI00295B9A2C|nr:sushi, von Willebrand factor type A, EGF and pentraxin domain-containing protein 1-like [Ruditapes philippinarum]